MRMGGRTAVAGERNEKRMRMGRERERERERERRVTLAAAGRVRSDPVGGLCQPQDGEARGGARLAARPSPFTADASSMPLAQVGAVKSRVRTARAHCYVSHAVTAGLTAGFWTVELVVGEVRMFSCYDEGVGFVGVLDVDFARAEAIVVAMAGALTKVMAKASKLALELPIAMRVAMVITGTLDSSVRDSVNAYVVFDDEASAAKAIEANGATPRRSV
eukprot:6172025-Pleurochrysis_carterae.AAC.1